MFTRTDGLPPRPEWVGCEPIDWVIMLYAANTTSLQPGCIANLRHPAFADHRFLLRCSAKPERSRYSQDGATDERAGALNNVRHVAVESFQCTCWRPRHPR